MAFVTLISSFSSWAVNIYFLFLWTGFQVVSTSLSLYIFRLKKPRYEMISFLPFVLNFFSSCGHDWKPQIKQKSTSTKELLQRKMMWYFPINTHVSQVDLNRKRNCFNGAISTSRRDSKNLVISHMLQDQISEENVRAHRYIRCLSRCNKYAVCESCSIHILYYLHVA